MTNTRERRPTKTVPHRTERETSVRGLIRGEPSPLSPQVKPRRLTKTVAQKPRFETAEVSDEGGENSIVCSPFCGLSERGATGGRATDIASSSSQPGCERAKSNETDKAKI